MMRVAKPHPVGAMPFPIQLPGNCRYPWCKNPEFTTDGSEVAVHSRVLDEHCNTYTGNMHVSHTDLFDRYGARESDWYDDGVDEYGAISTALADPLAHSLVPANHLSEIIHSVPTDTIYVSNLEEYAKRLDIHETLIVRRAGGSAHRTRVHVWRRML